jgi:hypothetical protein
MKNSTRALAVALGMLITSITNGAINPFYTEDFANGLPSAWQAIDSAGNGLNWRYTTTGSHDGNSLSSTGTSASNGYMIYDSDSAGGMHGVDMADLISGPIDCSTHPNVHLNFNEFLIYFNDTASVYVSVDGTNWTMVHNSSAGLAQYNGTPNPNNVDIDISSIAAGQDSVWIRFSYHADYSYYWMIDDVILHEVAQQDGALSSISSPISSCTLLSNAEQISVAIYNDGGDTIHSCLVTYIVDGGTPVTDTVNAVIPVGATYPYTFTTNADLSAAGTHTIQSFVAVTGDTNTTNDSAMSTLFNGPHTIDAGNSYSNGFEMTDDLSTFAFEDGNSDTMTWVLSTSNPHSGSMCALLNTPTADDWVFTTCLDLDSGEFYGLSYYAHRLSTAFQANLQIGIGTTQNSGGMGQLLLANSPFTAMAWTQGVHVFTVPASGTYYIGFEVSNADSAVGFALDDINVYWNNGNGIRENLIDKVVIYPNPSSGKIYLNSDMQSTNGFRVDVISILGAVVKTDMTQSLSNYSLDLSNQSHGVYIVRIVTDRGISTHRITIE